MRREVQGKQEIFCPVSRKLKLLVVRELHREG